MKKTNSYVFIPKEDKSTKNQIKLKKIIPYVFEEYFKIDSNKELIKNTSRFFKDIDKGIRQGSFEYDKGIIVKYRFLCVDRVYYLDITIKNDKNNIIKSLAEFNTLFLSNDLFKKDYIPIISYDYVSENYCNILFPLLNKFERKFRKLLFLIFTAQFKDLYFETTATNEMINNAKGIIKSKKGTNKDEYRIQNYFYSLDMATLRSFLFDKQWTVIEESNKNELLKKDLSKLTDEKLKLEISKIEPKSNWDRYFQNKKFSDDIDITMERINYIRNNVAHNKIVDEKDYNLLKSDLEKLIKEIDKAIKITETEDFIKIKNEKYENLFSGFTNSLLKLHEELYNSFNLPRTIEMLNTLFTEVSSMQNSRINAFIKGMNNFSKEKNKK